MDGYRQGRASHRGVKPKAAAAHYNFVHALLAPGRRLRESFRYKDAIGAYEELLNKFASQLDKG